MRGHEGVARLGRMALEGLPSQSLFNEAVGLVAEVLGLERVSAVTFDDEGAALILEAAAGFTSDSVRDSAVPPDELRAALSGGGPGGALREHMRRHGVASYVVAPIGPQARCQGYLCAASARSREFDAEETSFVESVANVLGDALRRDEAEQTTRAAAERDEVTGLANRRLMVRRLEEALASARRSGVGVAVALIDLDRFKIVNDSIGHGGGDELLRALAPRLTAVAGAGDTVARLGGDEFAVVSPVVVSDEQAAAHARELLAALNDATVSLGARELHVKASMGLAVDDGRAGAQSLLRDAGAALHHAKESGRARLEVFSPAMRVRAIVRMRTEADLGGAIERGEMQLHYQPYFSLRDRRVVGMEALVRWDRRGMGLVPPLEFVPLAEETSRIVELGEWVLRGAVARAVEVSRALPGLGPFELAINVSARQLEQEGFAELVERVLTQEGLSPQRLSLEVTESMVMNGTALSPRGLQRLKALGVRLAVDDFGTGYSSLSRIGDVPLDVLKIDRTFVSGLGREPRSEAIVHAIAAMASALGLDVIAEGVENERQLRLLPELGCDVVQGFMLARPVAGEALTTLLDTDRHRRAAPTRLGAVPSGPAVLRALR